MRKLWLMLRLLVAVGGIAYVAWSVTWTDKVVVPAGVRVRAGWVLEKATAFRVIQGSPTDETIVLEMPAVSGSPGGELRVASRELGAGATEYRFKAGAVRTIREARPGLLVLGLLAVGPVFVLQALRWWVLMKARRLGAGWWPAFRLYMAGAFFNYCMPGMTGGDVLKAYYAARDSDRRTEAVMSVVVDRVAGMVGLVLLAGVAGLFMLGHPLARQVTLGVWLGIAAMGAGAVIYGSGRVRRAVRGQRWTGKLPGAAVLRRIDGAVLAYRGHPAAVTGAVLLSVLVHTCLVLTSACAAYALGADASLGLLLTVMPLVFAAGAVPISYQGLGVMEGVAMALLLRPGSVSANQIVGMLLLVRVYPMVYALLGSVFVVRGPFRMRNVGAALETEAGVGGGTATG